MQIKSSGDLDIRDLPHIESPFFATSYASRGVNVHLGDFPRDLQGKALSTREVEDGLRNGRLFLVSGVTDDPPFSPVITWQADSDHPNGGVWHLRSDSFGLIHLAHNVESLNRWDVTPETICLSGPGCIGHLGLPSFEFVMVERREDERRRAKQNSARKLALPLGASASVAPLAAAAAATTVTHDKTPEKKQKPVHLEVGIFTDGTLNNAGNIEIFHQRAEDECLKPHRDGDIDEAECEHRLALLLGDSYANADSNIVKLRDLYTNAKDETETAINWRRRVYAPGSGSKTEAPDSLWGAMSGLGETGVIEQVKRAFSDVALGASEIADGGIIDVLTVDLFGFSRGAAAARHAANDIISGSGGELGKALAANGVQWPESVTIRFLGLFETVAAIMDVRGGDFTPGNDSNTPVNLYLDPATLSRVVQFRALDECRQNFALNSLHNPDGSIPDNFREIALPGVHSDLGGGYHDRQTEQLLLSPTLTIKGSETEWPEQTVQWGTLAALKETADAEGWIGDKSLPLPAGNDASIDIQQTIREHPVPDGQVDLDLVLHRQVRGELSNVYLHCMYYLAKQAGVPLNDIRTAKSAAVIPEELDLTYRLFQEQIWHHSNRPELPPVQNQLLKQRYVHHSDNYNRTEFLVGDTIVRSELPFATFISPFRPAPGRERVVYPNKPEA